MERLCTERNPKQCRRRLFTAEQIVAKSRQIEVLLSHENRAASRRNSGITDQTYCRWRREYGGLQLEQAKKLKDHQKENAQLKRALATLTLEKSILKGIAEGNL
jgi:putative transposase